MQQEPRRLRAAAEPDDRQARAVGKNFDWKASDEGILGRHQRGRTRAVLHDERGSRKPVGDPNGARHQRAADPAARPC